MDELFHTPVYFHVTSTTHEHDIAALIIARVSVHVMPIHRLRYKTVFA